MPLIIEPIYLEPEIEVKETKVEDSEKSKVKIAAECKVRVDGSEIKANVSSFVLKQFINQHHILELIVRRDVKSDDASKAPETFSGYLGKSISINVTPDKSHLAKPEDMEFVIRLGERSGQVLGLSVVFLQKKAAEKYAVAPVDLDDASLDPALVAGTATTELDFKPSQWLLVEW